MPSTNVARLSHRIAPLVFVALASCGERHPISDDVAIDRPDVARPDATHDSGPPCEPAYFPGAWHYTRTWRGSHITALAFDSDGSIVVAARFTGSVDLDPGPGSLPFTTPATQERAFLARLTPDGTFVWARVLDEHLHISGLAITRDGLVVVGGSIATGTNVTASIDFDPGPGDASQPVRGLSPGLYVFALHRDASFGWARSMTASLTTTTMTGLGARSDGSIVAVGTNFGGTGSGPTYSTQADAVPSVVGPYAWHLRSDGTTQLLFYLPSAIGGLAIAPDDSMLLLGTGYGSWDADFTYGSDTQDTNAVFGVLPSSWVGMLGPDFSYRWTRSTDDILSLRGIAIDADHHAYIAGGLGNQHEMVPPTGWDIDLGPARHMSLAGGFVESWDEYGDYRWANPPRSMYGSVLADAHGLYTFDRGGGDFHTAPTLIVASEASGRWRWTLTLGGTGGSRPEAMARGPAAWRAIGGTFIGTIDHAFGGAPADPHTAENTELPGDAYLTVFDDDGGSAPRCEDDPWSQPPQVICNPAFPTRCGDLQAECGTVADPCAGPMLDCGACTAPETCGGGGTPNRCDRPAPRVIAEGLEHPLHVAVDATHVYFTTQGDYGPLHNVMAGDGGVPTSDVMRLWRAPREGGALAEMLYETHARPVELLVGSDAVYVATEQVIVSSRAIIRVPKTAPSTARVLDTGLALRLYAERNGRLFFAGETDVMQMPADGSSAPTPFIRNCFSTRMLFDGGEVFYDCGSVPGMDYESVRSMPESGGGETVRTTILPQLHLEYVDASGIYYTSREVPLDPVWYRTPRDGTSVTPAEQVGRTPDPTIAVLGNRVAFDGSSQYYLWTGPGAADTRQGVLRAISLNDTSRARLARDLNHPRSIAIDGSAIWIAEEGSLGMSAHTGRVLRIDR